MRPTENFTLNNVKMCSMNEFIGKLLSMTYTNDYSTEGRKHFFNGIYIYQVIRNIK